MLLVFVLCHVVQRSPLSQSTIEVQVLTNMFLSARVCMCVHGDVLGYLRISKYLKIPQISAKIENTIN